MNKNCARSVPTGLRLRKRLRSAQQIVASPDTNGGPGGGADEKGIGHVNMKRHISEVDIAKNGAMLT